MNTTIDLTHSKYIEIPFINEIETKTIKVSDKGWSFSYVYHFTELRDVFLLLKKVGYESLNRFFNLSKLHRLPFIRTEWNERRLLEYLNALKNFQIIDSNYRVIYDAFNTSEIGESLTDRDTLALKEIYFSYFRFKEIFSWFIDPVHDNRVEFISKLNENEILSKSEALFCFSDNSRFTDSFLKNLENDTTVYFINQEHNELLRKKNNEDLMRFWDVFTKWGTSLGVLEKFNLKNLEIKTITNKSIACLYVLSNDNLKLDIMQYIAERNMGNYIYIPYLVLELSIKYRLKVETVQKLIIDQYQTLKERISFERTSEIFVKKNDINSSDKIFFPKYNDAYISHLIIRK